MPVRGAGLSRSPASRRRSALLALSVPLLIALALAALVLRSGQERLLAVPALAIGVGLLATSWGRRRWRRARLLRTLREERRTPNMER